MTCESNVWLRNGGDLHVGDACEEKVQILPLGDREELDRGSVQLISSSG